MSKYKSNEGFDVTSPGGTTITNQTPTTTNSTLNANNVLPPVNPQVSPIVIPTIPMATDYKSTYTEISDTLNSSYDSIRNERNTNLDNQARIDSLEKRIKKLKMDVIGFNKTQPSNSNSTNNTIIKPPKFY